MRKRDHDRLSAPHDIQKAPGQNRPEQNHIGTFQLESTKVMAT